MTVNRASELSLANLFGHAPVRTVLFVIAFVNWFVFFAVSANVGGDGVVIKPHVRVKFPWISPVPEE